MILRFIVLATAAALAAGCATTQSTSTAAARSGGGTHLVYWGAAGNVIRQFDYPTDELCRSVEKIAGGARCQPTAASGLTAQATLRYNPPGMMVHAYYSDMSQCQTDTAKLGPGVELLDACSAR